MFDRKFYDNYKVNVTYHNALQFMSGLSKKKVIQLLLSKGIESFITPDNVTINRMSGDRVEEYSDNRIVGNMLVRINSQCCSFSKSPGYYYLYPIHETELNNTGFTGDDLVEWIKWLNDANMGYEYYYLGVQDNITEFDNRLQGTHTIMKGNNDNSFHWVLVPAFGDNASAKIPYLHWISLRWMINTTVREPKSVVKSYPNIVRAAKMFNEDYGISKIRSLFYANIAAPYYSYYSIFHSDNMYSMPDNKPDVHINSATFKKLLNCSATNMNNTMVVSQMYSLVFKNLGVSKLMAPYDVSILHNLFAKGDYEGFISHIRKSYLLIKRKKNVRKTKKQPINK